MTDKIVPEFLEAVSRRVCKMRGLDQENWIDVAKEVENHIQIHTALLIEGSLVPLNQINKHLICVAPRNQS